MYTLDFGGRDALRGILMDGGLTLTTATSRFRVSSFAASTAPFSEHVRAGLTVRLHICTYLYDYTDDHSYLNRASHEAQRKWTCICCKRSPFVYNLAVPVIPIIVMPGLYCLYERLFSPV